MAADEAPASGAKAENQATPRDIEPQQGPGVLRKVLKMAGSDAAKYFPVRFVPALTSIVTYPLFTRLIDPVDYGYFFLISSTSTLAANIATGWISSSSVRFYWPSKREGHVDEYTATTVWTTAAALLGTAALLAIATWLLRDSLSPTLVSLVPIGLAYFVFNVSTNVFAQVLRAANRASAFAVLSITTTVLATALSVAFVLAQWGSFGVLAGVAAGNAVVLPFILRAVRREGSLSPRHANRSMLGEFLSYGLPLIPVGMSSWILVLSDRYVIQWVRGAREVAMYSVTYALGDKVMQLLTIPLLMTMSPMLIQTFEKQGQHVAERLQTQFTRYFAMVALPVLSGLAVIAPSFVRVFIDEQYWEAAPILAIVSAAVVLSGFAQIAGTGLGLHKRSRVIMENTLSAAVFNVVANLAFVPAFGYMAAAYSTVAAYGLLLGLTWLRSRKYMHWHIPVVSLGRVAIASGVAVLAALGVGALGLGLIATMAAQIVVGLAAYALALWALREMHADEVAFIRGLFATGLRRLRLLPPRTGDGR